MLLLLLPITVLACFPHQMIVGPQIIYLPEAVGGSCLQLLAACMEQLQHHHHCSAIKSALPSLPLISPPVQVGLL